MKMHKLSALFVFSCLLLAANAQLSPIAQEVLNNMDTTYDPCDDFHQYSCGGWMRTHPIPSDKYGVDRSIGALADHNTNILIDIVKDPRSGIAHDYYAACMDTKQIETDRNYPLDRMMGTLRYGKYVDNMAYLFKNGLSAFFTLSTDIDASEPTKMIYFVRQGGLTLPASFYLNGFSPAYATHISGMFLSAGYDLVSARKAQTHVLDVEDMLANITVPQEKLYNPLSAFNKMSWNTLNNLAPGVNFPAIINALGLDPNVPVTVDAPLYFVRLSALLEKGLKPEAILDYFYWRAINWLAPRLHRDFESAYWSFNNRFLKGETVEAPRNRTCLQETNAALPELLGRLYVERFFPDSTKIAVGDMVDAILSSYEINMQKLDWIDSDTMTKARGKLQEMLRLIGYPENPRDYTYKFGTHYVDNLLLTTQDTWNRQMAAAGGPSDRKQWLLSANIANAYYASETNSMVLPAGILQPPFFSPTFPTAMNYGAIGFVVGHELTHSLDPQGRYYNADGKLEDWWTPQTSERFQKRVDCIIQQYSKFSPLPGLYINGNLTQAENVADAGGLKVAYAAYVNNYPNEIEEISIVPDLKNGQLFFVSYAQAFCSKMNDQVTRQRLLTDPHSLSRFRVLGAAMNTPAFADAFKCKLGRPMNPPQRCDVW